MTKTPDFVATTNPCKACTPLGASLAFHGIEGAVCLLHGSQGCSTYIRRYLISHFKEPLDVASTNFSEHSAVFGGRQNFLTALENLTRQYEPQLIGVATTCLAETMGEDLSLYLHERKTTNPSASVPVVHVSTASYRGTHADGFHDAVRAIVEQVADPASLESSPGCVIWSPLVSPADLRFLKETARWFQRTVTLVPDWSDTLDGGPWTEYTPLPPGGTPMNALRALPKAEGSWELGIAFAPSTAGLVLEQNYGTPRNRLRWPVGVRATDAWFASWTAATGVAIPEELRRQRGRLLDSYIDGHKVVSGVRAAIFGEDDLVLALALFLAEIGVKIVAASTGSTANRLRNCLAESLGEEIAHSILVLEDSDFFDLENALKDVPVDLMVGNSKGYKLSRTLNVPLVRIGFPIHDRFGGSRMRMLGYDGTQELFDRVVNAILEARQSSNPVGYTYY